MWKILDFDESKSNAIIKFSEKPKLYKDNSFITYEHNNIIYMTNT